MRLAVFVSPHGFGHAARTSAVMAALQRKTGAQFELFTTAPRWFFEESVAGCFQYHEEVVDVGFRQTSALAFDLEATVDALRRFVPFDAAQIQRLALQVREAGCQAVLCDISPLGIAVAEAAELPSVVVENFTWGWLYAPLVERASELQDLGGELDAWMARATVHVQARPVCRRRPELALVGPISREVRTSRAVTRHELGLEDDERLVVITMGGHGEALPFLNRLQDRAHQRFLITGAPETGRRDNLLLFDNNTPLFMPDLLHAADALVAKLGYGTVSEAWREGIPLAGVTRPDFREMAALEDFARSELQGFVMSRNAFSAGDWIERLDELEVLPRTPHAPGGAESVADIVATLVGDGED